KPRFVIGLAGGSLPILVIVVATVFVIATQLPTTLFNYHDDFHKYLVRPFRMLQTGTLAGGPFDQVGLDSVGSQSFLHSFILARFPIAYTNGFDPVFAFLVGGLLINDIGRRAGVHWLFRTVAALVFVVINPQYVNVSALYSGTMMILGLMYASFLLVEARDAPDWATSLKAAVPFGLILAALLGLKVTFMPFAGMYAAIFFLVVLVFASRRGRVVGLALVSAATALVSFGPWLVLSYNNYVSLTYRVVVKSLAETATDERIKLLPRGFQDLFSTTELYYGGSYYDYNVLAVLTAIVGLLCAVRLVGSRAEDRNLDLAVAFAACAAVTISYFVSAYLVFAPLAIRYACPLLIAVLPAATLVLARERMSAASAAGPGTVQKPSLAAVLLMGLALAIGLFTDIALNRVRLAQNYRTMLSFRFGEQYQEYTAAALGEESRERTRKGQLATEEGEVIYAWIAQPYHLDFARNVIFTTPNPDWAIAVRGIDFDIGPEEFRARLAEFGVRYIMWEDKSFGMRSDESLRRDEQSVIYRLRGENTLSLKKMLIDLANASKIVHNDGQIVVADISK
ncbi:MAG: hypothetical protein O7B81_07690, partial [Gammaproteobacteria bacterium]|nr:hypothetical protein [Gammaproteobacteria bacterium]